MTVKLNKTNSSIATRDAFGEALVALGEQYNNLFVIDCDIGKSMKTGAFAEHFPHRHINVGIAEQNAACIAAGLAAQGKLPVISTYAVFGSMRITEQVRTSICYPNLHVILACSHGGLTPGSDGVTHQAIEDMGILRSIPNMQIAMPADYNATLALMKQAAAADGPVYLRFTRDPVPVLYSDTEPFTLGKGKVLRIGNDIWLLAIGDMVSHTLAAADLLERSGVSVGVADIHTLKPLDTALVSQCLRKSGRVVTVEDHNIIGGLGSAVCEVAAEIGIGRIARIGLKDTFAESGPYEKLLAKYSMDADAIVQKALTLLDNTKS